MTSAFVPAVFVLTAVFTAGALLTTAFRLGTGFPLYLAILGVDAIWLLPVHIVLALPAGLLGGIVFAAGGTAKADESVDVRGAVRVTVLATMVSLLLIGWMMPWAHRATAAAIDRVRGMPVESTGEPLPPAALELPALLAASSDAARAELSWRLAPVAACLALGTVGVLLMAVPWTWTRRGALVVATLVFVGLMRVWHSLEPGP